MYSVITVSYLHVIIFEYIQRTYTFITGCKKAACKIAIIIQSGNLHVRFFWQLDLTRDQEMPNIQNNHMP